MGLVVSFSAWVQYPAEKRYWIYNYLISGESISCNKSDYRFPIALVVGNETTGVSKEVLEIADQIVEIPMWGVNKSLNVIVSLGIVLYEAINYNIE